MIHLFDELTSNSSNTIRGNTINGVGIRLSICKTIVEVHGGTIYAKNHAEGAVVSFTIPIEGV